MAVLLVFVTGCAASEEPPAPSTPPTSAPPSAPGLDQSVTQWCSGQETDGVEQELINTDDGSAVMTLRVGSGTTTAILSHQTNGKGSCGFLFFAQQLAAEGISVILVDSCGYGRSSCPSKESSPGILAEIAQQARDDGAERVALVGASMGGSLVTTAAPDSGADAVVNLSGAAKIDAAQLSRDAPLVEAPYLVVQSGEDYPDLEATRKVWDKIPAKKKELIKVSTGHGYDFLRPDKGETPTTVGQKVIDWISG
ncbi:alpha/beta hydrolase [Propionibacteriaceae bacterium Y1700]|uniref:alpha/beta hydrolase n=1 Tax=Microlunatus sp. Y1700 TaxID=3418487 RepID=UPI003DA73C95